MSYKSAEADSSKLTMQGRVTVAVGGFGWRDRRLLGVGRDGGWHIRVG